MLRGHEIILIDWHFLAVNQLNDFFRDVGCAAISLTDCSGVLGLRLDRSVKSAVSGDRARVEGVDEFEHIFGELSCLTALS